MKENSHKTIQTNYNLADKLRLCDFSFHGISFRNDKAVFYHLYEREITFHHSGYIIITKLCLTIKKVFIPIMFTSLPTPIDLHSISE
jgi:hypothetical protein